MRLRKKELTNAINNKLCFGCRLVGKKMFTQIITELWEYKTIEDELGIDLITLFKALKDGIWMKKTNGFDEFFYHEKVASFSLYFKEIYVEHECEYQYPYSLKDYGKTWALTKEELL